MIKKNIDFNILKISWQKIFLCLHIVKEVKKIKENSAYKKRAILFLSFSKLFIWFLFLSRIPFYNMHHTVSVRLVRNENILATKFLGQSLCSSGPNGNQFSMLLEFMNGFSQNIISMSYAWRTKKDHKVQWRQLKSVYRTVWIFFLNYWFVYVDSCYFLKKTILHMDPDHEQYYINITLKVTLKITWKIHKKNYIKIAYKLHKN